MSAKPHSLSHGRTAGGVNVPIRVDSSGIVQTAASGGGSAVSVADGADVTQGALADSAVTGDNAGSLSAKLRGLGKILADVWDSINHRLNVYIQNTVLATTWGISIPAHDAESWTYAATTDTIVFKTGGTGGTTVATLVVTYTDSTKEFISTRVRT